MVNQHRGGGCARAKCVMALKGISDDGLLDEVNGKIKWGPFFTEQSRTVSFKVYPLKEALTTKKSRGGRDIRPVLDLSLAGTVSFDGVNQPITFE